MVKKNTLIMPEGWHWDMREKRGTLFSPDGEAMARYDLTGQNEKPLWVKGYPPFNLDHIPMEGPAVRKELEKSVLLEIETSKAQETPEHWPRRSMLRSRSRDQVHREGLFPSIWI